MIRWIAIALLAASPAMAAGRTVVCKDPITESEQTLPIKRIRKALKKLKAELKRWRIHVLDLGVEARQHRQRLDKSLAGRQWCLVHAHVKAMDDALAIITLNGPFLHGKFQRTERWARGHVDDAARAKMTQALSRAAQELTAGEEEKANRWLNRALTPLVGSADLWALPPDIDKLTGGSLAAPDGREPLTDREVEEACPQFAPPPTRDRERPAKGPAPPPANLETELKRLAEQMDARGVRPVDVPGGRALLEDLGRYVELGAALPATRVACGLRQRVSGIEINLGTAMKRFQHVNRLRLERGIPQGRGERFRALVKEASDHVAQQRFGEALQSLDALLVLLGETTRPSDAVPGI